MPRRLRQWLARILGRAPPTREPSTSKSESQSSPSIFKCERNVAALTSFLERGGDLGETDAHSRTALLREHAESDAAFVECLLKHGADVLAQDNEGREALHFCTSAAIAEVMLRGGARLEARDAYGRTPLYAAVLSDRHRRNVSHAPLVAFLIRKGSDVMARSRHGRTPLHVARSREVAELLLRAGAALEARDELERTPLFEIIFETHDGEKLNPRVYAELIAHLLERGADPNAREAQGFTPLYACRTLETLEVLLRFDGDLHAATTVDRVTPLHCAMSHARAYDGRAQEVSVAYVQGLLRHGASPAARSSIQRTPLHECETREMAALLLAYGGEVDARDVDGRTPLFLALQREGATSLAYVDYLLEKGASPRARDVSGRTPTHVAPSPETLSLLTRFGGDVRARDESGATPLLVMVQRANQAALDALELIRAALDLGGDPNAADKEGFAPLHVCETSEVARLLVSRGASLHAANRAGQTPLLRAVKRSIESPVRSLELVETLLELGADPTWVPAPHGWTALHYAASVEMIDTLTSYGAQVDAVAADGRTPLLHLIHRAYHEPIPAYEALVRRFLDRGASPNARDDAGLAPLHVCRTAGVTRLLLERGARVEEVNAELETPLCYAVRGAKARGKLQDPSYLETIRVLLERGASATSRNRFELTPLHLCWSRDVAEVLLAHGAELEARSQTGETPLLQAVHRASHDEEAWPVQLELVRFLLERGASPVARDHRGCAPLHYCLRSDMATLLLEHGAELEAKNHRQQSPLLAALIRANDDPSEERAERHVAWVRWLLERGANAKLALPLGPSKPLAGLLQRHRRRSDADNLFSAALNARRSSPSIERGFVREREGGALAPMRPTASSSEDALLHACDPRYDSVVRRLLARGAAVEARDALGQTPLGALVRRAARLKGLAEKEERHDFGGIVVLLESGANPRARDARGRTPLHQCSSQFLAEHLLLFGAEINARTQDGETPLYCLLARSITQAGALRQGSREFAELLECLLQHGANPRLKHNSGRAPLHLSRAPSTTKLLVAYGAYVSARSDVRKMVLLDAIQRAAQSTANPADIA